MRSTGKVLKKTIRNFLECRGIEALRQWKNCFFNHGINLSQFCKYEIKGFDGICEREILGGYSCHVLVLSEKAKI